MKTFIVKVEVIEVFHIEVEADTEEEAIEEVEYIGLWGDPLYRDRGIVEIIKDEDGE